MTALLTVLMGRMNLRRLVREVCVFCCIFEVFCLILSYCFASFDNKLCDNI